MTLDLTTDQEAIVRDIAHHDGKTPGQVLTETAVWLQRLSEDEQEQKIPDERFAEADDCTNWISSAEMGERVRQMLRR